MDNDYSELHLLHFNISTIKNIFESTDKYKTLSEFNLKLNETNKNAIFILCEYEEEKLVYELYLNGELIKVIN